ncbi:MAG: type II toxin-antitoxin system YafQ family toxin [Ignavibacteriae bacterium]|nr:type II toxin-antitoxin system YafQ family toxin [Ignavibacteriota bacterium]
MLTIVRTNRFKRDYKLAKRRGNNGEELLTVITLLANGKILPPKYKDHHLWGEYKDCRECHIEPDWLLIYSVQGDELHLIRTGTHADLFD